MPDTWFTTANILFAIYNFANLLSFLAFWPRNILHLRWLMAFSMGLLSFYFYALPGGPIYNALFWMIPSFLINIFMIAQIYNEQRDQGIDEELRPLYQKMLILNPSQFRKLTSISSRTTGGAKQILVEGKTSEQLHFLLKGQVQLQKGQQKHNIESGSFLGEVSFINQTAASATVTLLENSECITWDSRTLAALMKKDPAIDIAMRGVFNHDLALKVANSVPIQRQKERTTRKLAVAPAFSATAKQ